MKIISMVLAISIFATCEGSPGESSGGFDSPTEALESFVGHFVESINDEDGRIDRLKAILDTDVLPQNLYDLYISPKPGTGYLRTGILESIESGAGLEEPLVAKDWEAGPCREPVEAAAGDSIPGLGTARQGLTYILCRYKIELEVGSKHETEIEPIKLIKIEGKWWVI